MAKKEESKQESANEDTASKTHNTEQIILNHVGFSMVAGAIPIPIVDIVAVSAIQMDMLVQLAKEYEVDFNLERGKSLASSVMGAGLGSFLGRLGASAVKSVPGLGTILGIGSQVILAGASTYALGKVFDAHFSSNGNMLNINVEEMQKQFDSLLQKGKDVAEGIRKKESEDDVMATIEKLKALKDKGAISNEEFAAAKKDLLAKVTK
jgi:uncharacterized protein (DUF697 family)